MVKTKLAVFGLRRRHKSTGAIGRPDGRETCTVARSSLVVVDLAQDAYALERAAENAGVKTAVVVETKKLRGPGGL